MAAEIQTAQDVWPMLAPVVFVPHAERVPTTCGSARRLDRCSG